MTRLLFLLAALTLAPASAQEPATTPLSSATEAPTPAQRRAARQAGGDAERAIGAEQASAAAEDAPEAGSVRAEQGSLAPSDSAVTPEPPRAGTPSPNGRTGASGGFLDRWGTWIAVGALLLAALIGVAAFVTSRKRAEQSGYGGSVNRLNQPAPKLPRGAAGESAATPKAPVEPVATKAEVAALHDRIARIEQHLNEQSRAATQSARMQQAPPVQQSASPPSAPQSDAATAAASFASWCRLGGGLVDRYELFQSHLSNTLPSAVVEVVKRDLDSPARPIAFDATGGNSAAAYWLVRAGGELLLFPQPQSPQQFRDLAPAFAGNAAPQTVSSVEPARVSASGAGYVLTQPGRIA